MVATQAASEKATDGELPAIQTGRPQNRLERRQIVSILDVTPSSATSLEPERRALAHRHALARVVRLERGSWRPDELIGNQGLGLLIVDGLLLREVVLAGRQTGELLGPGDLFRPVDEVAAAR